MKALSRTGSHIFGSNRRRRGIDDYNFYALIQARLDEGRRALAAALENEDCRRRNLCDAADKVREFAIKYPLFM